MSDNKANRFRFRFWDASIAGFQYFEFDDFKRRPPEVLAARILYAKEWQQSTGLLDRNQKEIWEGDICRFGPGVIPDTYEVFWSETKWLGRSEYGMIDLGLLKKQSDGIVKDYTCEVIGNIYENQELLK